MGFRDIILFNNKDCVIIYQSHSLSLFPSLAPTLPQSRYLYLYVVASKFILILNHIHYEIRYPSHYKD